MSNIRCILYAIVFWGISSSQTLYAQANREMVKAQLNYCVMSLTNIVNNQSFEVLSHETDQLLNNLTIEQLTELPAVAEYRDNLIGAINNLQISAEERNVLKRIQSLKQRNLMWSSLSSALDPTILLTGGNMGSQVAFQALLTAARTAVEYKTASNELEIEQIQSMWNLRKRDMTVFTELRKSCMKMAYTLFAKFHLKESDRLTEATSMLLNQILREKNLPKKLRLLLDNKATFAPFYDYNYYLGMGYIDTKDYKNGIACLKQYIADYKRTPIFRVDEKSGCAALAILTYDKTTSRQQKEMLISEILKNLPTNGSALINCALVYTTQFKQISRAANLLRQGLDNPKIYEKNEIASFLIALLPSLKGNTTLYNQVRTSLKDCAGLDIKLCVDNIMAGPQSNYKSELASLLMLDRGRDVNKYASATMEIQWGLGLAMVDLLSEDPYVGINQRVKLNPSDAKLYVEQHADKVLKISEFKPAYIDPISKEDLLDEFDFFEGHEEGIYLFFDQVDDTNMLVVKPNLDYKAIKDGNIESLASITNDDDDWEELVDYCKKHSKSSGQYHFYTSKPLSKFKKTLYDYYDGYMFGIGTDFIKKWASSQKDKELVRGDFERIDFIGEELSYMPKYFNPYHEYYVTLELKDKKSPIHITFYIPEEDTQKAVPYSIKYGDKTYYLNAKAHTKLKQEILKIEQEQNNKKKEQEKSFWQKAIDLINF